MGLSNRPPRTPYVKAPTARRIGPRARRQARRDRGNGRRVGSPNARVDVVETIYRKGANVDIDFYAIYDKIIVSESLHGGER